MRGLALLALVAGCGHDFPMDRDTTYGGTPVDRKVSDLPPRGFQVIVAVRLARRSKDHPDGLANLGGELLSVEKDRIWLLLPKRDAEPTPRVLAIPAGADQKVTVLLNEGYEVSVSRGFLFEYARYPQGVPPEWAGAGGLGASKQWPGMEELLKPVDPPCNIGQVKHGEECLLRCPARFTGCDGHCRSLEDDPRSCGACGRRCQPGEACRAGACTAAGTDSVPLP
jgi:stigma-specific protein Stig1